MTEFILGQTSEFFTNGAFAAVLLCVGLAIGMTIGKRQVRQAKLDHSETQRFIGLLKPLMDSTKGLANDMSEYRSVMSGVSELFRVRDTALDDKQRLATAGVLSQVVDANEQLQTKLNCAETMLKEQADEIATYMSEARTDPLTNLPNRRAFDEGLARRMAEWRRHGRPLSILMVDIDHFKQVNDRHGHQIGDDVLRRIADVLRCTMRESDVVARFGGEEMAVILSGTDSSEACQAAQRVRRAIEQATFVLGGRPLKVTVSVGAAQCDAEENVTRLVKRADDALYAAKQAGRNRAFWHDGIHCLPVGCAAGSGTSSRTGSAGEAGPPQEPTCRAPSFAQVCQDLRRRLEEVAGETAGSR